jgi:hypothetical protein
VCGRVAFTPPPYERQQPLSSTGSVIESPLTLVKTRMESSLGFQYTGIIQVQHLRPLLSCSRCWCDAAGVMLLQALRSVHRVEGAVGLMRGWAPTLARDAPCVRPSRMHQLVCPASDHVLRYAGMFLVLYDSFKRAWGLDVHGVSSASRTFACSTAAGFIATLATQPFDVIRTRVQLDQDALRSAPYAREVLRHGLSVAMAGFWPRLVKRTLASSVTWTVFEQMMSVWQHQTRPVS